jgi:hypothetical protein
LSLRLLWTLNFSLVPILSQYSFFGISNFSLVVSIFLCLISVIFSGLDLEIGSKTLALFMIACLGTNYIYVVNNGVDFDFIESLLPLYSFFIILFFVKWVDLDKVFSHLSRIGILASALIIIQFLMSEVFDIYVRTLTILPVYPEEEHFWGDFERDRFSGFFAEPEAFCTFIVPVLLFSINNKKYHLIFLFSIAILLSKSTSGIAFLMIAFILFIKSEFRSFLRGVGLIIFLCVVLLYFYRFTDVFIYAKEKLITIDLTNDIRLVRGFVILSYFDIQDWLLGTQGHTYDYILAHVKEPWVKFHLEYNTKHLLAYVTSATGVFVRYGIVTGSLFWFMIIRLFKLSKEGLPLQLCIMLIIFLFTRTFIWNGAFIYYFVIISILNGSKSEDSPSFNTLRN